MTQEQKEIILKDLCARLPYGVVCKSVNFKNPTKLVTIDTEDIFDVFFCSNDDGDMWNCYEDIKPYLFPLSSMTKEQSIEYINLCERFCPASIYSMEMIDWFHKNHFDYRGLIPKGLAIDATGLNIY
jgi:hypothetical protein